MWSTPCRPITAPRTMTSARAAARSPPIATTPARSLPSTAPTARSHRADHSVTPAERCKQPRWEWPIGSDGCVKVAIAARSPPQGRREGRRVPGHVGGGELVPPLLVTPSARKIPAPPPPPPPEQAGDVLQFATLLPVCGFAPPAKPLPPVAPPPPPPLPPVAGVPATDGSAPGMPLLLG